jgi:hypothetical protein
MKFIELLKIYKVYILAGLLVIFFFRSCSKSTQVRKNDKVVTEKEMIIDRIHSEYDNYISEKDRGEQLMELHMMIKKNLKELQDEK